MGLQATQLTVLQHSRCAAWCRYDLHVLLVEHGKCCERCAKNNRPRKEVLGACPLFGQHSVFEQLQHSPQVKVYDTSDASASDED